jgi:hypothetical protein
MKGEYYLNGLNRLGLELQCSIVIFETKGDIDPKYEVDINYKKLNGPHWYFKPCPEGANLWIQNPDQADIIPFNWTDGKWSIGTL